MWWSRTHVLNNTFLEQINSIKQCACFWIVCTLEACIDYPESEDINAVEVHIVPRLINVISAWCTFFIVAALCVWLCECLLWLLVCAWMIWLLMIKGVANTKPFFRVVSLVTGVPFHCWSHSSNPQQREHRNTVPGSAVLKWTWINWARWSTFARSVMHAHRPR